MPIKNLTLGLALVFASSAVAADQKYTVKANSPISAVAKKFSITVDAVAKANNISTKAVVKAGTVLRIPTTAKSASQPVAKKSGTAINVYVVRNGDNDYTIAHKFHLTVPQLHAVNQGVDFSPLKLGQKLIVPASLTAAAKIAAKTSIVGLKSIAAKSSVVKTVAAVKPKAKPTAKAPKSYTVRGGENNWIIAHHLGVKLAELKAVNPGVNLERIHNGQVIKVPARAYFASKTPKTKAIKSRYAVIAADNVNIRRAPSTGSETVTTIDEGIRVVVLDRDGAWYKLRFPKGTVGWVRNDFIAAASAPSRVARATRRSRDEGDAPRRTYAKRTRSGHRSSGSLASISGSGSDAISEANRYLGVRYSYGSASRSATDCSGLVNQVYRKLGVKLPRTSREMSGVGVHVSKGEMKPGDLVFFHTRNSRGINHVGIYAGNGKFIHASSGGGKVQVNNLSDGYYAPRLSEVRRVAKVKKSTKAADKAPAESTSPKAEPAEDKTSDN